MKMFPWGWHIASGWVLTSLVVGCQMQPLPDVLAQDPVAGSSPSQGADISLDLPEAWGGAVRCSKSGCLLGAVEHEKNKAVLYRLEGRTARILDRQPVAYHPDSAVWLADHLLAVAVEASGGIDLFRVVDDRLVSAHQVAVGFPPRDVIMVRSQSGRYQLLATPYGGAEVAWIDWREDNHEAAKVQKVSWCRSPWHPVRVDKLPRSASGGIAVACLDDRKVVAVSDVDLMAPPQVLANFPVVPRQARPTPSGLWLYVALETGGRNARIHMESGELQWISAPPTGAAAVAPLADDLVIWGDDSRLTLQRLGAKGEVLEIRVLRSSGFSTSLQLQDVDGDGQSDLIVLNSTGKHADVIYGPLWDRAQTGN